MKHVSLTPKIFICSVLSSLLIILLQIFRLNLVDVITPFIEPVVELLVIGIFIVTFIWSIIYLVKRNKNSKTKSMIPLLLHMGVTLIIIFIPFENINLNFDFKRNYVQREEVVSLIKSGEINNNSNDNNDLISLPNEYSGLSKSGEIIVDKKANSLKVLFYTYRGIMDNFSGFIYDESNETPKSISTIENFKEIKKIKEHWFWISS